MNDSQYNLIADEILIALEEAIDESGVDIDYESAGGILTLIFLDKSKIIINKQAPLQQVWVATRENGHHFAFDDDKKEWNDVRGAGEFWQFMSKAVSAQAGTPVELKV